MMQKDCSLPRVKNSKEKMLEVIRKLQARCITTMMKHTVSRLGQCSHTVD